MAIKDNLERFREKLQSACIDYGRDIHSIEVMAVSKTRSVEEIIEAREAGLALFGENRIDEAQEKFAGLDAREYPLVLIGHLQSNKVNRIDRRVTAVHSVDTLKIARKLSQRRREIGIPLDILIQVNTSQEDSKSGFRDRSAFLEAADEVSDMPFLQLRGVMTMAPFVDDESIVRRCFAACREWSESLNLRDSGEPILSMGMSSDFLWAVAEGSTMLRIGTTLFGERG